MNKLATAVWITRAVAVAVAVILCLTICACCSPSTVDYRYLERPIPAIPAEPWYYPISRATGTDGYRFDVQNFKNLIKNIELLKGNRDELREIISGMTTTAK